MSDEKRKILELLSNEKINVDEAERLLKALGEPSKREEREDRLDRLDRLAGLDHLDHLDRLDNDESPRRGRKPKYLYISIKPKEGKSGDKVNVRVPLFILRTGLKFGGLMPDSAKEKLNKALGEKGVDISKMDEQTFEELVEGLSDLAISIDDDDEKVRIYCE